MNDRRSASSNCKHRTMLLQASANATLNVTYEEEDW